MAFENCPVCAYDRAVRVDTYGNDASLFLCEPCGNYRITGSAESMCASQPVGECRDALAKAKRWTSNRRDDPNVPLIDSRCFS